MSDFELFVDAELPRLLRFAMMLTGERELAADLVQDVLVKAFRQWSRIAATRHPDQYLLRMVTNEHVSWRRRWSVRSVFFVADLPDRAGSPDSQTTHAQRNDMWQRLARLPPRQRAVLVLRYYEQLVDSEIAEVLGCSPSTVRGYAYRALASLRAGLRNEMLAEAEETR